MAGVHDIFLFWVQQKSAFHAPQYVKVFQSNRKVFYECFAPLTKPLSDALFLFMSRSGKMFLFCHNHHRFLSLSSFPQKRKQHNSYFFGFRRSSRWNLRWDWSSLNVTQVPHRLQNSQSLCLGFTRCPLLRSWRFWPKLETVGLWDGRFTVEAFFFTFRNYFIRKNRCI